MMGWAGIVMLRSSLREEILSASPRRGSTEWEHVIQAHGITTFKEYRRTSRVGRGKPLTLNDRKAVWEVMDEYRRALRHRNLLEWKDVIRETRRYIEQNQLALPYKSVVVDEAQDFHPEDWRLVKAIAPSGDDAKKNDAGRSCLPLTRWIARVTLALPTSGSSSKRRSARLLAIGRASP